MAGQGKIDIAVVTDNSLRKVRYEKDELGGAQPVLFGVNAAGVLQAAAAGTVGFSIPRILPFPDFAPSIVASFVAGTTATQSGTLVTVTATAHGIVGSTAKNGYRIYYPGSPSIPAGWYQGFAWVDANTITFTNPVSQTVASESVNAGAIYTANTTIGSLTLPGGSMGPNGRITARAQKSGDATASSKNLRLFLSAQNICTAFQSTAQCIYAHLTINNMAAESVQYGAQAHDSSTTSGTYVGTVNTAVAQPVSLTASCSASASWHCITYAELEVLYKP